MELYINDRFFRNKRNVKIWACQSQLMRHLVDFNEDYIAHLEKSISLKDSCPVGRLLKGSWAINDAENSVSHVSVSRDNLTIMFLAV